MSFAELAQEMSGEDGEDGEEVKGGNQGDGEEEISQQRSTPTGKTLTPSHPHTLTQITDSPEQRRRSQRCAHRKHTGHRTELGTFSRRPRDWDCEEVAEFLNMQGFGEFSQQFQEGEVDGESMFLLKEHHLVEQFGLKLGPALKLLDTISRLRHPPP